MNILIIIYFRIWRRNRLNKTQRLSRKRRCTHKQTPFRWKMPRIGVLSWNSSKEMELVRVHRSKDRQKVWRRDPQRGDRNSKRPHAGGSKEVPPQGLRWNLRLTRMKTPHCREVWRSVCLLLSDNNKKAIRVGPTTLQPTIRSKMLILWDRNTRIRCLWIPRLWRRCNWFEKYTRAFKIHQLTQPFPTANSKAACRQASKVIKTTGGPRNLNWVSLTSTKPQSWRKENARAKSS